MLGLAACGSGGDGAGSGKPLPKADLVALQTGKPATWPTGKPLVVNVWASWCTPCRTEMPAFDRVAAKLDGKVAIVGVTDEPNRAAARKAADRSGVHYPLLVDTGQQLQIDLSIASLPATVFVASDGTILGRHVGALTEDELLAQIQDRYGIAP